jgi:hypothetical protein
MNNPSEPFRGEMNNPSELTNISSPSRTSEREYTLRPSIRS